MDDGIDPCCKMPACVKQKTVVIGEGSSDADWMIVGEAPAYKEQEKGRPFIGDAGQALDTILQRSTVKREDAYLTNVMKCRLTDRHGRDRAPTDGEIDACTPLIWRQIEAIHPKKILLLGRTAIKAILPPATFGFGDPQLRRMRGKIYHTKIDGDPVAMMPTYHPSPRNKKYYPIIEQDVKKLAKVGDRKKSPSS